jgi:hypothetical protein
MRKSTRQFIFQRVYDMAAMIEECIEVVYLNPLLR